MNPRVRTGALLASAAAVAVALLLLVYGSDKKRISPEKSPSSEAVVGARPPDLSELHARASERLGVEPPPADQDSGQQLVPETSGGSSQDASSALDLRVVLRGTERGIAGVRAEAGADDLDDTALRAPLATGTTDPDGRVLLLLPSGVSKVRCWNDVCQGSQTFDLAPGERRSATLEIDPTVVVMGRVLSASTHGPIVGAEVWVDRLGNGVSAVTNSAGEFVIPFFPASGRGQTLHVRALNHGKESAQVNARPDGSWTSQRAWLVTDGDLTPEAPGPRGTPEPDRQAYSPLDRESGRRAGSSPPVFIADLVLEPERTIRGRVLDEKSDPIDGVRIQALGHYVVQPGMAYPDRASAHTDRDGWFAIAGTRPDVSYQIECSSPGRSTHLALVPPARIPIDDIGTIVLPKALVLRGRVLDAMDAPVEDILVRVTAGSSPARTEDRNAWPRDPAYVAPLTHDARTDAAGEFELSGLSPGQHEVSVACGDTVWRKETLNLRVGADASHELRLPPNAPMVSGRAWNAGSVASELRVTARSGEVRRTVTTDSSGGFRFVGLPPGATYELLASTWHPGDSNWAEDRREVHVEKEGSVVDLKLRPVKSP